MRINWEQRDDAAIARIEGRIDSSNTVEFERVLESGLNPTAKTVVMDFERVAFMSSAGLRVVLMLTKQLRKRGAQAAVCSLPGPIREVFSVSGVDRIVPTHSSDTQAIDALSTADAGSGEQEPPVLRGEIDFDVVGDNLKDIAGFTIEKYEYINECTLSEEMREEALVRINDALWQRVEQLKRQRMLILKEMFISASRALDEVVESGSD
jgi:anti-anti-sigma factor